MRLYWDSLAHRLVVIATAVLIVCLGLTGFALERAFLEASLDLVRERLQAQVYALLTAAEMDDDGRLAVPEAPPEPRLSTPASGLYAYLVKGTKEVIWRSPSAIGRSFSFPAAIAVGSGVFALLDTADPVFAYVFAIDWEAGDGTVRRYAVQIAERRAPFDARLSTFRRTLWGWFGGGASALVLAQALVLAWGLAPLRRVAVEVRAIEQGQQKRLTGRYPRELGPLTRALNALIDISERRLERYQHGLAELAHSLKTPLAVMRAAAEANEHELRVAVAAQVERMDRVVGYQLQRAAATGTSGLGPPLEVAPLVASLANSLHKVYAERGLVIATDIAEDLVFRGDEGDLMEMLGNLMDNACKWAASAVWVSGYHDNGDVVLTVEDDGPGIPGEAVTTLLKRGGRTDADVPGQGIGLAVVVELCREAYHGELSINEREGSGASVRLSLPMPE